MGRRTVAGLSMLEGKGNKTQTQPRSPTAVDRMHFNKPLTSAVVEGAWSIYTVLASSAHWLLC